MRSRRGFFGFFRSAREALRGVAADIAPVISDPRNYDTLILGTPMWAGHVSSPVRGYLALLAKHSARPKRIAFFCTMGGSKPDALFAELSKIADATPVAVFAATEKEVASRKYVDGIGPFMESFNKTEDSGSSSAESLTLASAH